MTGQTRNAIRGAKSTQQQSNNQGHSNGDVRPDPEVNGRGRLQERDLTNSGYATKVLYEGRPLSVNDID